MLKPSDVDPKLAPSGGEPSGTALYSFYCHANDIATLRAAAHDTTSKYRPDVTAAKQAVLRSALALVDVDTAPPISFK